MPYLPLRSLPPRPLSRLFDRWLEDLGARLADREAQDAHARALICRDTLAGLLYPQFAVDVEGVLNDESVPIGARLALSMLDPRNVTLEPEYYADCDPVRFQQVKPLLWLWYSFDRSPFGGQNVELGVRLRRLLAPYIFRRCGENFKCFQHVEFSFGYNIEVGDNVVIHRHVLLDDRGGIVLGNRVSISDYANIYSHTHSIIDQRDVTNRTTVLCDGVRVTYHATLLAGVHVGEEGMIGALAVVTHDVDPYSVNVGVPARCVAVKSSAPAQPIGQGPSAAPRERAEHKA
jgi:acetyltransferase-like isoleucine patch superfamily enzyme